MTDRQPLNPRRVKVTDETTGESRFVTWEYADNPKVEGTPLNKATLLSDETAQEILGRVDDPTVDMALYALAHRVYNLEFELSSDDWQGEEASFTQTVSVENIKETDNPIADVGLPDDSEEAAQATERWGCISKIETMDGQVKVTCFEDRPETDISVRLMVVR